MSACFKDTGLEDTQYLKLTDEEIDEILLPFIKELKEASSNHRRTPAWTDYMKDLRRIAILRLVRQGKANSQIVLELHDRWGIKLARIKTYISDCLENLSELDDEPLLKKKKIEEMLEETLEACKREHRYKDAMQALDMLNKMGGNYISKVEAEIKTEIQFDFGGEEDDKG